jgi:hypothetical protein
MGGAEGSETKKRLPVTEVGRRLEPISEFAPETGKLALPEKTAISLSFQDNPRDLALVVNETAAERGFVSATPPFFRLPFRTDGPVDLQRSQKGILLSVAPLLTIEKWR